MTPFEIPRQTVTRHNTFEAIDIDGLTDADAGPIDLSNAEIKAQYRTAYGASSALREVEVGDGITLIDGPAGSFRVDSFRIEFPAGLVYYDIKITLPSTEEDTYFKGTINVLQGITL